MLTRTAVRSAARAMKGKQSVAQPSVAFFSAKPEDKVQQATMQSLVTEIAEHQKELASKVRFQQQYLCSYILS